MPRKFLIVGSGTDGVFCWRTVRPVSYTHLDVYKRQQLTGIDLGDLRPEALFAIPHTGQVQLLSDDGSVTIDGVKCKRLPASRQTFRSLIVTP